MATDLVNADFAQRVVIATDALPWLASPQAGVERRLLDRIGGEVARATSLVRYAPTSAFPAHDHAQGEEYLVLEGVFSDEHGDYPVGTYVRNPPGSHHSPRTAPGCVILVKLRQMPPDEQTRVVIDTTKGPWQAGESDGHQKLALHHATDGGEQVWLERLAPGASLPGRADLGGEEIFVMSGELATGSAPHGPGTWIRNPPGHREDLHSGQGALYWVKRGHLTGAS
jgi:anti-sigma factor ChrR (cupin superfamily)